LTAGPPELGTPDVVAKYLHTTGDALAQKHYLGNGPKFIKMGRNVSCRWPDVLEWLAHNTIQRTDDPRG